MLVFLLSSFVLATETSPGNHPANFTSGTLYVVYNRSYWPSKKYPGPPSRLWSMLPHGDLNSLWHIGQSRSILDSRGASILLWRRLRDQRLWTYLDLDLQSASNNGPYTCCFGIKATSVLAPRRSKGAKLTGHAGSPRKQNYPLPQIVR